MSSKAVYTKPGKSESDLWIKEELDGLRANVLRLSEDERILHKRLDEVAGDMTTDWEALFNKVNKVSSQLSFVLTVALVGWALALIALAGLARFGGLI